MEQPTLVLRSVSNGAIVRDRFRHSSPASPALGPDSEKVEAAAPLVAKIGGVRQLYYYRAICG
jgi:hypothetical protein